MDIQVLASGSKGNCYRVSDGRTSLLLECGIPIREIRQKLNFQLHDIDSCLVTHEHLDHSKAVMELLKAGIEVCMTAGTSLTLDSDFLKPTIVKKLEQFRVGTFDVLPFQTEHDAADPVGYLIYSTVTKEKLIFATDTYYCKYKFTGLTHIMIECNYSYDILVKNVESGRLPTALKNRLLQSHFSLDNVKKFLAVNDLTQVKTIYLLHLSDGNSDEARFKREVQELTGIPVIVA